METRRPFTRRNVISAAILGVVALGYWLSMGSIYTGSGPQRNNTSGEAAGLGFAVLLLPTAYTTIFFLATFSSALQRGSPPISYWLLVLALLPTLLILLFLLYAIWF